MGQLHGRFNGNDKATVEFGNGLLRSQLFPSLTNEELRKVITTLRV